jgi:hypothetical protein
MEITKFKSFLESLNPSTEDGIAFVECILTGFTACFEAQVFVNYMDDEGNEKFSDSISLVDGDEKDQAEIMQSVIKQFVNRLSTEKVMDQHIEFITQNDRPIIKASGMDIELDQHPIWAQIVGKAKELLNSPKYAKMKDRIEARISSDERSEKLRGGREAADANIGDIQASLKANLDKKKRFERLKAGKVPEMKDIQDIVNKRMAGDNEAREAKLSRMNELFN